MNGIIVYFDLETTGLNRYQDEVIQIGARCGGRTFVRHIQPGVPIHPNATKVNGFTVDGYGRLLKYNQPVNTAPRHKAWSDFVHFLGECAGGYHSTAVITAHNGFCFDIPFVLFELQKLGMLNGLFSVARFGSDTRELFPPHLKTMKLSEIAYQYNVPAGNAHDALGDVDMMRRLCGVFNVDESALCSIARPLQNYPF